MKREDSINRFVIRIVMGGKHTKNEVHPEEPFVESVGSLKRFFKGGLEELKKDIAKKTENSDRDE